MPKLITSWDDLVGLENEQYYLEIDTKGGAGFIKSKTDEDFFLYYLSTHTFYGQTYQYSTAILQECGFDVQLENWDGETIPVDYTEQWKYSGKCGLCKRQESCRKYKSNLCPAAKTRQEYS